MGLILIQTLLLAALFTTAFPTLQLEFENSRRRKKGIPMTNKLQVASVPEQKTQAASIDQAALLRDVVAQIRQHSGEQSKEYLDETTVPHGGE